LDVGDLFSVALYEGLVYGFVAVGVYLTFRVLAFPDLSVDGSFPLGGAIAAIMIVDGFNPWLATIAAFGAGACAGLGTALLNTKLRINALLAGILMMVGLYSINLMIMGRPNIPLLREVTVFDQVSEWLNGIGVTLSSVHLSIVVMVVLVFAVLAILNGLALRATGDNEQMVRGLGTSTDMTTILGVSLSNGLVALSGALVAQNQGLTDIGMGIGMIIMGLASVIVGEGLFRPRGVAFTLLAVVGGAFAYRLILGTALRLGMDPNNLKLITALLVIAALSIPYIRKKMRHEWIPPAARW